jgi:uncharacterized protein (TIGR02145 family)
MDYDRTSKTGIDTKKVNSMKQVVVFLLVIFPVWMHAQKNVVPVSATSQLQIRLPDGSTQDKRSLSVMAGSTLLNITTGYKGLTFSPVEVYYLPSVGSGGYDAEQLIEKFVSAGNQVAPDPADNQLAWVINGSGAYLIYYAMEADQCDLYIGRSSDNPFQNAPPEPQPHVAVMQPQSVPLPGGYPDYVPPLASRVTSMAPPLIQKEEESDFVYDLDGNRYTVIKMGNRFWTKENLRTTQYRDTTAIATGLSAEEWSQTKTGAYAVYDDNPAHTEKYGLLYNGYAAASGKLCPEGWHVATDKDWQELEKFLGIPVAELDRTGERGNIADQLKTENEWEASAYSGNNSSQFSILPAGNRKDNGEYTTIGQYGNFWTSTVYDDRYGLLYLWNHHVHFNSNAVGRIYTLANNGYSCRCVKDQ